MAGERMSKTGWRWTQALRELFSAFKNSLVNREKYREIAALVPAIRDNPRAPSTLAPISAIFTPIGTGNYQGMNRELKFPVNWDVAKMFETLAGDAL
jgi:hypothetical protein